MWWTLYRIAFWTAFVGCLGFALVAVSLGWVSASSPIEQKLGLLAVAIVPPYSLWLVRRLVTGRWLG